MIYTIVCSALWFLCSTLFLILDIFVHCYPEDALFYSNLDINKSLLCSGSYVRRRYSVASIQPCSQFTLNIFIMCYPEDTLFYSNLDINKSLLCLGSSVRRRYSAAGVQLYQTKGKPIFMYIRTRLCILNFSIVLRIRSRRTFIASGSSFFPTLGSDHYKALWKIRSMHIHPNPPLDYQTLRIRISWSVKTYPEYIISPGPWKPIRL